MRGRRLYASGRRTTHVVGGESGRSRLSLEVVIKTGLTPAAEIMASEIESVVTGAKSF